MLLFALPIDALGWSWGEDIRDQTPDAGPRGTQQHRQRGLRRQRHAIRSIPWPASAMTGPDSPSRSTWRSRRSTGSPTMPARNNCSSPTTSAWCPKPPGSPRAARVPVRPLSIRSPLGLPQRRGRNTSQLFPAHFTVRSKDQGIWMPFTDVSTVRAGRTSASAITKATTTSPWTTRTASSASATPNR